MDRKPTDQELTDQFNNIFLKAYETAIDKLEELLKIPGNQIPASIYKPSGYRLKQSWMLEYLKKRGNDVTVLEQALAPLDSRFLAIRDAHKDEYLLQMLEMLRSHIKNYFPESIVEDPTFFETRIPLRDNVESMRGELVQFIDISKDLEDLRKKDEIFISLIPEAVNQRTYFPMDLVEAPPEIWWRHLEEKYGERVD